MSRRGGAVVLPLLRPSLVAYNGYDAGLGNRVRVVLGAKSLAELEGRDFFYVWPTGALFGPQFSELWEFRGKTVSRATSRLLARLWPYGDETLDWLDDDARRRRLWQIRTGSDIQLPPEAPSWHDELRRLTPVPAIADRVTQVFDDKLRGTAYVGVMIRAHQVAHARSLATSPIEWFVDRMLALAEQRPGTRFFLSCDVPEVASDVRSRVPDCVTLGEKGAYNSVAGVRDAVADLYLLAASGHLLGPHFSSFIHLAEHLAGPGLVLETPVTQGPDQVDTAALGLVEDPLDPHVRTPVGDPR